MLLVPSSFLSVVLSRECKCFLAPRPTGTQICAMFPGGAHGPPHLPMAHNNINVFPLTGSEHLARRGLFPQVCAYPASLLEYERLLACEKKNHGSCRRPSGGVEPPPLPWLAQAKLRGSENPAPRGLLLCRGLDEYTLNRISMVRASSLGIPCPRSFFQFVNI
ncbi:hypothetical protein B0H15DRAFT_444136 [Mycena belliarum]|uniref:Uncharacterized protein n=1 Tax=Mycena belliarum TaxID=1033014 RepID=A0AAD6TWH4_9AGAR|nr:hypothetical protein B0H15DRAFT_444136 [Mycena belliae]